MLGQVLRQKSKLWRQGQILKSFSQDNSPLRLIYTVELGPSLTELDIGGLKNTATGESSWRANSWRGFGNLPGPSELGLTRTRLSLEGMNAEAWKGLHTSTKVEIEQVSLNNIADNPRRKRKRLGRGIGSGKGKTSGRGHKGQKARTGRQVKAGFEGGQAPAKFYTPKRGFHNPFSLEYVPLNLSKLQHAINQGKLKSDRLITMRDLRNTGIVSRHLRDGIKLLARGKEVFDKKINIQVSQVSAPAREAIEKAGGTVTTVYYTALGLRALVMPEWFTKKGRNLPRPARPHPKKRKYWDAVGSLPPVADTSASRIENLG